jgi:hypothetical protein
MLVADIHDFRGGSAVDAGNEHGRETGGALLALSGAAGDDHGTQFMYISCLLIRFNSILLGSFHDSNTLQHSPTFLRCFS